MSLNFEDLNNLQKYCDNQMSLEKFVEALTPIYYDKGYIEPLYADFRSNPVQFITSRNEKELFNYIISTIEKTNYKG